MTRILLILNERSILLTESPLSGQSIRTALQSGTLDGLPPEIGQYVAKGSPSIFESGGLVVIAGLRQPADRAGLDLSAEIEARSCPAGEPCLTSREAQVLQALALGLTVKEIAYRFSIRPRTVREYVRHINEKFGAQTTEQAVGRGVLLGLCGSSKPR